jgi:hypothetical protein
MGSKWCHCGPQQACPAHLAEAWRDMHSLVALDQSPLLPRQTTSGAMDSESADVIVEDASPSSAPSSTDGGVRACSHWENHARGISRDWGSGERHGGVEPRPLSKFERLIRSPIWTSSQALVKPSQGVAARIASGRVHHSRGCRSFPEGLDLELGQARARVV